LQAATGTAPPSSAETATKPEDKKQAEATATPALLTQPKIHSDDTTSKKFAASTPLPAADTAPKSEDKADKAAESSSSSDGESHFTVAFKFGL
jgi:hypothetical protein